MKRRKRRKKRQILPESVPEKHSPSGAKESDFTLANAMTQWLYSTKDRIVKILSFCDLNTKMVEVRGVEPLCEHKLIITSTCVFCHFLFMVQSLAGKQAAFRLSADFLIRELGRKLRGPGRK